MRDQKKRIFINDLPERATEVDIENAFKDFGNVLSVEIKKRKEEIVKKHSSSFFAYVNIEISEKNLQQCFNHFANTKWLGQNVILQIARESFLERLKREREENEKKHITDSKEGNDKKHVTVQENFTVIPQSSISNGVKSKFQKYASSESEDEGSDSDDSVNNVPVSSNRKILTETPDYSKNKNTEKSSNQEIPDLVIKNNKGKVLLDKRKLKIESVGNKPIIIDKPKEKPKANQSKANLRRLKSLNDLKKHYQTQKSVIQSALSQIDSFPKNKIKFDDIEESESTENVSSSSRKHLFDNDQSDDDANIDFSVKEQFQGKEGQKLLSLQSRYKNDKRFVLDSRFVDNDESHEEVEENNDNEESSLQEEKKMEYEILGKVLGKSVYSKSEEEAKRQKKAMLRFDPTQPEHSKFEMKQEVQKQKRRKKDDKFEDHLADKRKQEEKEVPEVSKEKFYKVTENLKDSLHEKQEFSLLSMFGKNVDKGSEEEQEEETPTKIGASTQFLTEKNPFRYDSSEDEEETEVQKKEPVEENAENSRINKIKEPTQWSEPFFFKYDDYRLQEGFDFVEKMKAEVNPEFRKLRRDLKEIVKAKVRNNQRKHRPFRKKLGGNKRKKMIRMKKALKR